MTNLERIRRMTAEEFAEFLDQVDTYPCTACCNNLHMCRRNNAPEPACKRHYLEWLKEEVRVNDAGKFGSDLHDVPTCELVKELQRREGVETHTAEPYQDVAVSVNGPAVVLVVID